MTLKALILLYLAIVLSPLALAWAAGLPPRPLADELAGGAGMLAFSILLAEFLLSGRFRAISGGVGLDVTLRLHQMLARSALLLALVHPFLYQLPMAPQMVWDTTRAHTVTADFGPLAFGIVAWLLLPVLVLAAAARNQLDFSYETWRLMHGLGAAVIAVAVLLHTLKAGRYASEPIVAGLWIGMTVVALASLVTVYLITPLRQLARRWMVARVTPAGPRQWEVEVVPEGHRGMDYEAGQFAWLNIGHSPFALFENPFSIASAPAGGPGLRFIIKELGDFTRGLGGIKPGTRAYLDGPHGNLTVTRRAEPGIALIGGGVGIAPLIGILRQLQAEGDPRPRVLVYGNRIKEQIICADELTRMAADTETQVVHVLSEPPEGWSGETGLIDAALIRRHFGTSQMRDWLFIVCGPPAMMETVETALSTLGVPSTQVLSERFSYD